MDIVGLIKKSYRGSGSLFSDKFRETFLKGDTRNVSFAKSYDKICCCVNYNRFFANTLCRCGLRLASY